MMNAGASQPGGAIRARPTVAHSSAPTLLIGLGNRFRRDDGIGLRIAQELEGAPPVNVAIVECDDGASLLDLWAHARATYVVDAASSGAAPGTIHRIDARAYELPAGLLRCSTHNMGVAEAIAYGRLLGTLPWKLIIYGIEVADVGMGVGLSPAVEAAVPIVVDRLKQEFHEHALVN